MKSQELASGILKLDGLKRQYEKSVKKNLKNSGGMNYQISDENFFKNQKSFE